MPPVGPILQGARVQAGLTLEHVSAQTRIPVRTLSALEADDFEQVTSAFFYKSFVRQFAARVNLPYESIAEAVAENLQFYPETMGSRQLQSVAQHAVVKTRKRNFNLRSWLAAASATVLLLGCSAVYSYWENRAGLSAELSHNVAAAGSWLGDLLPGKGADEVRPSKPEAITAATAHSEAADNGFRVELSATEASWLSIVADGRQTFSGILEPSERKVLEGHDNGRVRTGNAGGVQVVFNGKPVGPVGPRGTVRVVVFTKSNYEVFEPARSEAAAFLFSPLQLLAARWLR